MMTHLFRGAAIAALMIPVAAYAQETTSSIRGTVTLNGRPIPGATVTVTHEPSGTVTSTLTGSDGTFSSSGLRVGGPFTVKVTGASFDDTSVRDIQLTAGQPLRLPIAIESSDIVVTASRGTPAELSTGPISSFSREEIEGVASVSRDIRDIARRDPFATIDQSNSRTIEIAGQNGRLNKFSVDGVRFSDNFGLNNGGLPTARGPVPLDAIEQLSVKVAPYDVSEGDFQGGAINVVLRSGGNKFTGSGFYAYTDDSLTGDKTKPTTANPTGDILLDFKSRNYGGFISGPVFKDTLFFAFSYERLKENRPADVGLAGFAQVVPNLTRAQVDGVTATAMSRYNYDPQGLYNSVDESDEKYTAKIDWNISDSQRASFTYIHNVGSLGNPQGSTVAPASPGLGLRSNAYLLTEKVDSGVFQLNSDWADNFHTEARINYRKSDRGQVSFGGLGFGQFTVCLDPTSTVQQNGAANTNPTSCSQGTTAAPGAPRILFGADPSRQANALSYESYGGDLTARWDIGNHSFKAIASYNHLSVFNLFVQNAAGSFFFDSLADYNNGRASQLVLGGSITGDINDAAARYSYDSIGASLQDSWDISDNFNATFGVRTDLYSSNSRPFNNQNFFNRYGFPNTETYSGKLVAQPRLGLSWTPERRLAIRGGIGLFAGGSPDVWLSNSFSNTGVVTNSITINRTGTGGTGCSVVPATLCAAALDNVNGRTFDPAVLNFLRTNTASLAQATVNAIDPDFHIPSTWKSSLSVSYDADLGFAGLGDHWLFGGDVYYGFVRYAPNYTDLRVIRNGTLPDGRPRYLASGATGAGNQDLLLTNTQRGRSFVAVARFDKQWDFGLGVGASYTFQDIKDVNPTTSATASSNYNSQAMADPNIGVYGTSIYQIRNEVKFNFDYHHAFFGDNETRFSLFGEWRSGRPYSITMNDNTFVNGRSIVFGTTGQSNRYLLYVPQSATDALVSYDTAATQAAVNGFIDANLANFRGRILPKNTERAPSYFKVDLHVDQEIPVPLWNGAKIKLFADLENVLNLIDSSWGSQRQVNFPYLAPLVNVQCLNTPVPTGTAPGAAAATVVAQNAQPCVQYRYSNYQAPVLVTQNQNRQSLWGVRVGVKFQF